MKPKKKQNIRITFTKGITLCISFLYLVSPLHKPLTEVFHQISHNIHGTTDALVHDPTSYGFQDSHFEHGHKSSSAHHEHGFLDFFDGIFSAASDFDDSNKDLFIIKDLDKHLMNEKISLKGGILLPKNPFYPNHMESTFQGYVKLIFPPPRFF
ncbi:MAG: hypothetical protein AAF765_03130 [Bacteroidota bacterium]